MEYVFTHITTIFGVMLILYGFVLLISGDVRELPYRRRYAAKMKNKQAYVRQIGKFVLVIGSAFLLSGAVGFISQNYTAAAIVLVVALVAAIVFCVKTFKYL